MTPGGGDKVNYVTVGELIAFLEVLIDVVTLCVTVFALITRNNKKK